MPEPLLLIAIDGGDEVVVDHLVERGSLPVLADLQRRGASVAVDPPGNLLEECVHGPLYTGRPVGDHALAFFYEFDPATMGLRFRREVKLEPFWLYLPDNGRGTLVLDIPEIHPHPESKADEVCEWHSLAPVHRPLITSASLRDQIRAIGEPPVIAEPAPREGGVDEEGLARDLMHSLRVRFDYINRLVPGRNVACVGIHEIHVATHWLAHHFMDGHWAQPANPRPEFLFDLYEELDRGLGRLIQTFRGNVALVLTRGMEEASSHAHLLDGFLQGTGLLKARGTEDTATGAGGERAALTHRLRQLLPEDVRERIARRVLPEDLQHRLASRRFRDTYVWSETKVLAPPSWTTGLLRANVVGREAEGVVPPGELGSLLDRVGKLALEMREASSKKPLVKEVVRAVEAFPGRLADRFPDLLLAWEAKGIPTRAWHPEVGEWEARPLSFRPTDHKDGGRVILQGPSVRESVRTTEDYLGLAPTLLELCGVERPSSMTVPAWSSTVLR